MMNSWAHAASARDDLVFGARLAERDVLADGGAKEEDVLPDISRSVDGATFAIRLRSPCPSIRISPRRLHGPQQQRHTVDLPPPEGPTSAVTLPGSASSSCGSRPVRSDGRRR